MDSSAFSQRVLKVRTSNGNHTADLIAFTAKAFTTVRAGFALTLTSLPNAMRLPAFVAGLWRVLIMHTPGMVNFPRLTSLAASSARASKYLPMSALFESHDVAKASAMALFGSAFTPFIAFIAFIFFAILSWLISASEWL